VRPVPGPYGQGGLDGLAGQSHGSPGPHRGDVERPRASAVSALPTLRIRHPRRSRLPLVMLMLIGTAGASVGVWFAVGGGDATAPSAVVQKA